MRRRQGLAGRGLHYLVGVESNTAVWDKPTPRVQPRRRHGRGRPPRPYYRGQPIALRELAVALPPQAWHTLTWRQGTQGPQRSRFAACRVQPAHGHAHRQPELEPVWVLIEWPMESAAPTKYWFSNLPEGVSLHRLVRLAKLRWRVEQNYHSSRRNSAWTTTKAAAGKAGIIMSPWYAWPTPFCCWSGGGLKKLRCRLCPKRGDVCNWC